MNKTSIDKFKKRVIIRFFSFLIVTFISYGLIIFISVCFYNAVIYQHLNNLFIRLNENINTTEFVNIKTTLHNLLKWSYYGVITLTFIIVNFINKLYVVNIYSIISNYSPLERELLAAKLNNDQLIKQKIK